MERIGVVLGSREATPLEFWVGVEEGQVLRLDDLVVVETRYPGGLTLRHYGVVDHVARLHEGQDYDTDTFLAQEGLIPVSPAYIAHVSVTRILPEEYLPPEPAAPVYLAQGPELERALYYDGMQSEGQSTRLPVGLLPSGAIAYANVEFINGLRGGHVNISGISGVAAKTSYATFLVKSLLESGVLPQAHAARVLFFNVKGEDLFFLDKPNRRLPPVEAEKYRRMGLRPTPFDRVAFLAPPRPESLLPQVETRLEGVKAYHWDLVGFCREGLLPFLFADRESQTNLGFLIGQVTARLQKLAEKQKGPHLLVPDWAGEGEGEVGFEALGQGRIGSFAGLIRYLEHKLLGPEEAGEEAKGDPAWTARQARGTLQAFIRRLWGVEGAVRHLIRGDRLGNPPDPLKGEDQVHVVDIGKLPAPAQSFVVGAILQDLFAKKERGAYRGPVFVVLDELNKYAPKDGDSPIKRILLDIAERGRSLGVILIGAQQTASEVEPRVVANAAIRVVGRLDAAEAERPAYGYLPTPSRRRALLLPPGVVILSQPEVPVPLLLRFPFPSWATKRSEVQEDNSAQNLREEFL